MGRGGSKPENGDRVCPRSVLYYVITHTLDKPPKNLWVRLKLRVALKSWNFMASWVIMSCARGFLLCGGRQPEIWHRKIVRENGNFSFTYRFTYTYTYAPFTLPAKSLRAAHLLVLRDCKIVRNAFRLTNTSSHIRCFGNISWGSVPLTHWGRVTQICVFNTVKLGTSASYP